MDFDPEVHPRPTRGTSKPRAWRRLGPRLPRRIRWDAVSGLIWTLETRDPRLGRHSAAVARLSRDIARTAAMSDLDREYAYIAGLLHDIGHLTLPDRVYGRGATLNDQDWIAIALHPEVGAKLLEVVGLPAQVACAVRSHHERVDGRGYPTGLCGDQIPDLAKIVAVAEVYDTLTASDTYRPTVSSFEALRELRRVVHTQLDERYVEALAKLLRAQRVRHRPWSPR